MHAIAPAASIQVFEAPNTDPGLIDAYGCMVNPSGNATCPNRGSGLISYTNSTSWGLCETLQLTSTTNAMASIFSQAATQGQSFFAASGDTGSDDCGNSTTLNPSKSVDSPASDLHMTGVGGTRLLLNTDNTYNSETAWPPRAANPTWGSGGGYSTLNARPVWQTGPGVDVSTGAKRQVPDISLDADPVTGYSIYTCKAFAPPCNSGGGLKSIGGTSAGAPAWAAFTAIYNQYAACQGQPKLGFANPVLYPFGVTPPTFTPFNDITTGDNVAGNPAGGYSAGAGYDMVTGLGTLRAADFSKDLAGAAATMAISSLDQVRGFSGETIQLFGCGFQPTPTVTFGGGVGSAHVSWITNDTLAVAVPLHPTGDVDLVVTNPGGGGSATLHDGFHYNRSAGHQVMATNVGGRLEAFVTGADGNLYHTSEATPSGPFGALLSLGRPTSVTFVGDPAVGVNADGRLEIFVIGSDGLLWHAWQAAPGSGWSSFFPVGSAPPPGMQGEAAVSTNSDGRLEIFARAADNFVWHAWQAAPNSGWGAWSRLGAPGNLFASDVTVGRNGDGRLEVAAVDATGISWHAWQTAPSSGWSNFFTLAGRNIAGTPGINTNQDGRLEIFAQAADDRSIVHIYQAAPSSGWVSWSSLGGQLGGDPAVSRNSDGRLEVFAFDLSGSLIHMWQLAPNSGWGGIFSLSQPGAPLVGDPHPAAYADGRIQILAQDLSGRLWQIIQASPGSGWSGFSSLGGPALLPY